MIESSTYISLANNKLQNVQASPPFNFLRCRSNLYLRVSWQRNRGGRAGVHFLRLISPIPQLLGQSGLSQIPHWDRCPPRSRHYHQQSTVTFYLQPILPSYLKYPPVRTSSTLFCLSKRVIRQGFLFERLPWSSCILLIVP